MSVLLPFAFVDTRRPISPTVVATDASGSSAVDAGGYAVVLRHVPPELARGAAARAEKWRYHIEDAIAARAQALKSEEPRADDDAPPSPVARAVRKGDTNFEQVPSAILGDIGADWQLRVRGRFSKKEDILRVL